MAINMSPGVYVKEKDLTDIVRGVDSSSAGIVGYSAKGSVDEIMLITNNQQFIAEYGEPDPTTGHFFHYAALEYLRTGNKLHCLRVANSPLYAGMDIVHLGSAQLNVGWTAGHSDSDFDLGTGIAEVQTLTPDAVATAGTFTLTYGADTTTALDFDATTTDIQNALNLLASVIAIGGITITGTTFDGGTAGLTATFATDADDVSMLVINITSLTGPSTVDVVEAVAGDDGGVAEVAFQVMSVNPGAWGNRVAITIEDIKDGTDEIVTDQYTFHIIVSWQDDDGNWAQVEDFTVSRKHKIDGFGRNMYIEDRVNGMSAYIRVADSEMGDTALPKEQTASLVALGGSDGSAISSSELVTGWGQYSNPEEIDVRMLIGGGETAVEVQLKMQEVAETRFDCVALLDVPYAEAQSVSDSVDWRNDTQQINSSYTVLDAPWPKKYDPYNDRLIEMPPSGFRAQAIAYTDLVAYPWNAAAGFTRGQLNVNSITPVYNESDRDTLSSNQINMFQDFGGEGNVIWHQLTQQKKASALCDLNVRRLLIQIEKSLSIALRRFVHENNNALTRFRCEAMLVEYLELLASQGAFQQEAGDDGFHVVCDTTNNTAAKIDRNILAVDVFVKPARVIYYVNLQVVVTKTGTSFEELIARGVTF